jgi:hypothetical protein
MLDRDLSDRVDSFGWGLLFVSVGATGLIPDLPEGSWLIAAGIVMLGASAARGQLRLPVRVVTVAVGGVALAAGIGVAAGLAAATGPIVLIVLGLVLVGEVLLRSRRSTDTPTRSAEA